MARSGARLGTRGWAVALLCLLSPAAALCPSMALGERGGGVGDDVEAAVLLDEIEAATAKHERLDRELEQLDRRKKHLKRGLMRRVRALYRITRWGRAPLSGGFSAVLQHVGRIKHLRSMVRSEARQLTRLGSRQEQLRGESDSVAGALDAARARLSELQTGGAAATSSAPRSFESVLSQESSAPYRAPQESYGMRLVDRMPENNFVAERGRLSSPVSGEVRVVEARRPESDGPGLEFQAPAGTPVRAVAAGRVAFSDRYGSYGRIVILDHGQGYYTVYGGLGAVEVRVGDDLSKRARIGGIGSDSSPPALFFEVRQGTRTLPPHEWLGF